MSLLPSCTAPARTTRLQSRDFEDISSEIAESLRASDFLAERAPVSPRLTVALEKVDNLSTDILSDGEKWLLMDGVIDSAAIRALRDDKNIRFVIPIEKLRQLRREVEDDQIAAARSPTHTMTARLRSVTRAMGLARTDLYAAQYSITDLADGATVWTGEFLLKRAAQGKAYN